MDSFSTYTNPLAIEEILTTNEKSFVETARYIFQFQYHNNFVYRRWVDALQLHPSVDIPINAFPFLPISFFKTHRLIVFDKDPEITFSSSGTSGMQTSNHHVYSLDIYVKIFIQAFKLFYGEPTDWAIIGLLPSYLERQGSSLVLMVEELIKASNNIDSGLFLYDFEKLKKVLKRREAAKQKTWIIGVTYALIDFAAQCPMQLEYTVMLETGGMKGRKKEMTRMEVQQFLKQSFQLLNIHSEYGMTELLSQAYSASNGLFKCPPWMKVLVREEDDPLMVKTTGVGALCIIDFANMYSCSFIATDDLGKLHADGSFEILGRIDNSDVRGCSLLTL